MSIPNPPWIEEGEREGGVIENPIEKKIRELEEKKRRVEKEEEIMRIKHYKLLTGVPSVLEKQINNNLRAGFILYGLPFSTGNRIESSKTPTFSDCCTFVAEIAQAMVLPEEEDEHKDN